MTADIRRARWVILASLALNGLPWVVAAFLAGPAESRGRLDGPAILIGVVCPVFAYRLFLRWRGKGRTRAALGAMSLGTGASLLCLAAYVMSDNFITYIGPAMLLLTACAIWPGKRSRENL